MGNMMGKKARLLVWTLAALALFCYVSIYPVSASAYEYDLTGLYDESGSRDGSISVTLYQNDDSPETHSIDHDAGSPYSWDEDTLQIAFKFDLGNNETRTYYVRPDLSSETIYIFRPDEPFYQYYFTVIDYVGVTNGFLETLINKDGTERVVERWSLGVLNELPFTCSFGSAYRLRLVCNEGIYYFEDFVAGGSTSIKVVITEDMFPDLDTSIGSIEYHAIRVTTDHIEAYYSDVTGNTTEIAMKIWEYGSDNILASIVEEVSVLTWNIYGCDEDTAYYVQITAQHEIREELCWVLPVGYVPETPTNPFAALDSIIDTDFPVPASNLFGYAIILLCFGAFNKQNMALGIIVSVIVAMMLAWIGFISITWTWLSISLGIAIVIAFSISKEREEKMLI